MASLLSTVKLLRPDLKGWFRYFGPVLYYDLIRQARRRRFVVLRFCYALFLVLLLAALWASTTKFGVYASDGRGGANIAESYFDYFIVAQFLVVTLLTPAYVGGAIAEEKERKTLDFMLATDLGNREIVLSKLVSRLANLTLVVLTSLPIVAILQFLGGVDPNLVLAVFAVTSMTVVSQACVCMLCSVLCQRSGQAIGMAYLMLVAFYLGAFALASGIRSSILIVPPTWDTWFFEVLYGGTYVGFLNMVRLAGNAGTLATWLPILVRNYAYVHGAIALICILVAIVRVRRVALAQAVARPVRVRTDILIWSRPPIRANALLWKELHCGGGRLPAWAAALWMSPKLVSSFVLAYMIVIGYGIPLILSPDLYKLQHHLEMNWLLSVANFLVGSWTIAAIGMRASTTISSERDKQTLDTLLTTPLSGSSILNAKWVGCMLSVRVGIIWLGLIWFAGAVSGAIALLPLLMTIATWAISSAFAAVLGIWFSLVCRSWSRAAVGTMLILLCINIGPILAWWCFGKQLTSVPNTRYVAQSIAGDYVGQVSPMFLLLWLPLTTLQFSFSLPVQRPDIPQLFFCYATMLFWLIITHFLYRLTLSRFNQLANRIERAPPSREDWFDGRDRKG